jgi:thiamine pyrophosphate-dependent acetolactate synthase large subunit-like protein
VSAQGGDSIDAMMNTLRKTQARIRFAHLCRDMSAALTARGHCNRTASLCVCLATSGCDVTHSRSGRCDARRNGHSDLWS